MIAKSQAKYLRISCQKIRPFLRAIKGKKVEEVYASLRFIPNKGAQLTADTLKSAVYNAVNNVKFSNNTKINKEDLYIANAFADGGPTLKRRIAGSHGTAKPIHKRTAHVTIELALNHK